MLQVSRIVTDLEAILTFWTGHIFHRKRVEIDEIAQTKSQ